jgi:SAM-dependent methyltransferase
MTFAGTFGTSDMSKINSGGTMPNAATPAGALVSGSVRRSRATPDWHQSGARTFYERTAIGYPDVANPYLLSRIPANALTILDVGCGSGALGAAYRTLNPRARLLGIECNPDVAAIAEQHLDAVACVDVEQNPLPLELPNGVDCLIYGDILQQLRDPWSVLRHQLGALNPRGAVLICVANAEHWSIAARLLRGTWEYESSGPLDIRHLRWFSLRTVMRALTDAGLVVEEAHPRIFATEQAHQFVQMLTPGLQTLGINPSEYISRALPLQYVVRARRNVHAPLVTVKSDLCANDASLAVAAPSPADLDLRKEVAADDVATGIVYFGPGRRPEKEDMVESITTFSQTTENPHAAAGRQPSLAQAIMQKLYAEDIWENFVPVVKNQEVQDWNGNHPSLRWLAAAAGNAVVIDVGVWKGQSTITMANAIRSARIDGCVIAVDTFLGSREHWSHRNLFTRVHGRPNMYDVFLSNVATAKLTDYIVPMPQTSLAAAKVLYDLGIRAAVVHIDAAHQYEEVLRDVEEYWTLLAPGGYLIGDDYHETWPGVVRAAGEFSARVGRPLAIESPKWILQKPKA